ncbi:immunoglobulin lambda-1 light chain-like [Xyrichtys novacula]|nr:immunoglobulin lambda-1 light chain-like [Xyrichtys novacula]
MILLLCLTLYVQTVSGSSYSDNITQTRGDIFTKTGNPAIMTCRHTVSSFNRILWYKQLKSKEIQFLGNMFGGSDFPEDKTEVKIEGNANANKNCTLTILAVDLNSSAVYFCAASIHNASYLCFSIQKPSDVVFSSSLCHSSPHLYQSAVTVFFSSP